jgi:signal transduction histidine kinase/CheY-like chemotaxis protein/integral membrane sensor domain MASE1
MSATTSLRASILAWHRLFAPDVILVAMLYFCSARISLLLSFEKTNACAIWPPAGFALATLVILGPRAVPGILLGAFAANLVTFIGNGANDPLSITWWSLLIAGGNACGAFCGWWMAGRLRVQNGFTLDVPCAVRLLLGSVTAGVIAGVIGATVLVFGTGMPSQAWPIILRIWATGDTLGILIFLPLLLSWLFKPENQPRHVWLPYTVLAALALVQIWAVPANNWPTWSLLLAAGAALWIKSRRALWTTITGAVIFVLWQALMGLGPLAAVDESATLLKVQALLPLLGVLLLADAFVLRQSLRPHPEEGLENLFSHQSIGPGPQVFPALVVTILGVAITLFTWSALVRDQQAQISRTAQLSAEKIADHFTASLLDLRKSVNRMASRWEDAKGMPEDLWRSNARRFNEDYGCLQATEWIDRDTVIRWIEPLAGNEAALGLRLSDEPIRRATLEKSRTTHTPAFTSLITLKQGGIGFILYMPIRYDGEDHGFIVTVFRLENLLQHLQQITRAWDEDHRIIISQDGKAMFDSQPDGPAIAVEGLNGFEIKTLRLPLLVHAIPQAGAIAKQTGQLPLLVLNAGLILSIVIGISITLASAALNHARQSRKASQVKARFLATMSHEIRTPMNGILGAVELALARTIDAETRQHLALADQCGRNLLTIINDILDFSKNESGNLAMESLPLDLAAELHQVMAMLLPLTTGKGLQISAEIEPTLPKTVLGDGVRLRQVMINLMSNAVKFTERGSVTWSILVTGGTPEQPVIEMVCRDTGIGMDAEAQTRLFQPFVQADATTTRRFGGTGLGLAIVHQIVTLSGGTIRCESSPGNGTAFIIQIPMTVTNEQAKQPGPAVRKPAGAKLVVPVATALEEHPEPTTTLPTAPQATSAVHVLLAEDNLVNQYVAKAMLIRAGCTVVVASDGAAAVACCSEQEFSVVFMDMQMPIMDGVEATRGIRAQERSGRRVPIIALTANAFLEQACADLGISVDPRSLCSLQDRHRRASRERPNSRWRELS